MHASGVHINDGTLYPALASLEAEKLVAPCAVTEHRSGGRTPKYVELTAAGRDYATKQAIIVRSLFTDP